MLHSLDITGFRGFSKLSIEKLARVNVFVGKNGSGKTTVLESVELLGSPSPVSLKRSAAHRREVVLARNGGGTFRKDVEAGHLFHGHLAGLGTAFSVRGRLDESDLAIDALVTEAPSSLSRAMANQPLRDDVVRELRWTLNGQPLLDVMIGPEGGLQLARIPPIPDSFALRFVDAVGDVQDDDAAQSLWRAIATSAAEEFVVGALQLVAPDVVRVTNVGVPVPSIHVRRRGAEDVVPIGSLGDGANRLFVLAANLAMSEGGAFVIDEIETALHVSVMEPLWRMVIETALKLNVQVFATTHSDDCLRGLARALHAKPELRDAVLLHRIERGEPLPVTYDAEDIMRSASSDIDLR